MKQYVFEGEFLEVQNLRIFRSAKFLDDCQWVRFNHYLLLKIYFKRSVKIYLHIPFLSIMRNL